MKNLTKEEKEEIYQPVKFPQSFDKQPHPLGQGWQWKYTKPNGTLISIVGGSYGLYGDGVRTFEMYDFDEDQPRGCLTTEEINDYLKTI